VIVAVWSVVGPEWHRASTGWPDNKDDYNKIQALFEHYFQVGRVAVGLVVACGLRLAGRTKAMAARVQGAWRL